MAQTVKNLPAMQETWVRSLGWDNPLEEDMATHSSILAWRIPMDRGAWWATVHRVAESDMTDLAQHSKNPIKGQGVEQVPKSVNPASNTPDPWHSTNRWKVCLKVLHRAAWGHTNLSQVTNLFSHCCNFWLTPHSRTGKNLKFLAQS